MPKNETPGIEYETAALCHELDDAQRRTLTQIVEHYEPAIAAAERKGMEKALNIAKAVYTYSEGGETDLEHMRRHCKRVLDAIRAEIEKGGDA